MALVEVLFAVGRYKARPLFADELQRFVRTDEDILGDSGR